MDDLLEAMRRQPESIRWVGEWVGGPDHPTIWQLARAAGVLPELMRYESFQRAQDVAAQLQTGQFVAGIAGYTVFDPLIRSGAVRGLGIVSRQPLGGVTIPTFRQLGIVGVSMTNWCGAFAPPSASDADRVRLADTIKQMVQSPRWAVTLNRLHLRNVYLGNPGFAQLIQEEQKRLSKAQSTPDSRRYLRFASMLWKHLVQWALVLGGAIAALSAALYWQKSSARRREDALQEALRSLSEEVQLRAQRELDRSRDIAAVRLGMNTQIEREFDRWGLTPAERSIAHLMLKGMRLKGIAEARNTSDRTVRQQAQAIYRKAGLEGRTDLAAYFLETVLGEPELQPVVAPPVRPLAVLSRGRTAHQHLRFPAT
jgi:DNA-binding CsgD family transcriptional regulator